MNEELLRKHFGKVLQASRLKAGLSQENLADRAELDRTYISLLERGERTPTLATLFKLAEALDVAPALLVSRTSTALE